MTEPLAGQELDALVAEKVMGWEYRRSSPDPKKWFCREYGNESGWWKRPDTDGWGCATCSPPPEYSRDIAAAWEVVEKLQTRPHYQVRVVGYNSDEWLCDIANFDIANFLKTPPYPDQVTAEGNTAPLAVCRAALKAVGA